MKHTRKGNFFSLPNEVFLLGLSPSELAVYSYLRRCENRKTHQCWPSYKTIGKAVGMSENTARKYTLRLEERGLITTEPTEVITRNGQKRNGNLLYTILPFQEAINHSYERQIMKLEEVTERQQVAEELRKQGRVRPSEPLCAQFPGAVGSDTAQLRLRGLGPVSEELARTKVEAGESAWVVTTLAQPQTPAVRAFVQYQKWVTARL